MHNISLYLEFNEIVELKSKTGSSRLYMPSTNKIFTSPQQCKVEKWENWNRKKLCLLRWAPTHIKSVANISLWLSVNHPIESKKQFHFTLIVQNYSGYAPLMTSWTWWWYLFSECTYLFLYLCRVCRWQKGFFYFCHKQRNFLFHFIHFWSSTFTAKRMKFNRRTERKIFFLSLKSAGLSGPEYD